MKKAFRVLCYGNPGVSLQEGLALLEQSEPTCFLERFLPTEPPDPAALVHPVDLILFPLSQPQELDLLVRIGSQLPAPILLFPQEALRQRALEIVARGVAADCIFETNPHAIAECLANRLHLRKSERLFAQPAREEDAALPSGVSQVLIDSLPNPLVVVSRSYRIVFANRAAEDWLEVAAKGGFPLCREPRIEDGEEVWTGEDLPCPIERVLETGQPVTVLLVNRKRKRHELFFELECSPLVSPDGSLDHVAILYRDITSRLRAQLDTEYNKHLYETLVETIPEGVLEIDRRGNLVYYNQVAGKIFDFTHGNFGNCFLDLFVDPTERRRIEVFLDRLFTEYPRRSPYVGRIRSLQGRIVDIRFDWNYKRDIQGNLTGIISVITDVTGSKRAEEESSRLATIVSQVAEAIVLTDCDGTIRYANPAFERTTGYRLKEVMGEKLSILKSGEHDDSFFADLWKTVASGLVWRGKIINKRKDGTRYISQGTITPLRNQEGEISGYVSVMSDVTHEIELENRLQQALKMEAVGQLAGGIAHDFNNLLQAILGYTQFAQLSLEPDCKARADLDQVFESGRRAADLVRQLLTFSRQAEMRPTVVDVAALIQESIRLLKRTMPANVEFVLDLDESTPHILADPTQIQQIIFNLCVNARDAMPMGGGHPATHQVESPRPVVLRWARPRRNR